MSRDKLVVYKYLIGYIDLLLSILLGVIFFFFTSPKLHFFISLPRLQITKTPYSFFILFYSFIHLLIYLFFFYSLFFVHLKPNNNKKKKTHLHQSTERDLLFNTHSPYDPLCRTPYRQPQPTNS